MTASGDILALTSLTMDAINTGANVLIGTSTTVGTIKVTITLDLEQFEVDAKFNQIQTLMELASVFDSCLEQTSGVLATSNIGTAMQLITGVATQAATAGISLTTVNQLFCESNPPVPVKVFIGTNAADALVAIINAGMYICTGDPANPNV